MATDQEVKNQRILADQQERYVESTKELLKLREGFASIETQLLSTGTELLENEAKVLEAKTRQLEEERELLKAQIDRGNLSEQQLEDAKKHLETLQDQLQSSKDLQKSNQAYINISSQADSIFESIASRMMISRSATAQMAKNLRAAYKEARKTDSTIRAMIKTAATIGNSFLDMFSPMNLLSSSISKILTESFEMMKRTQDAYASFVRTTGTFGVNIAAGMDLSAGVNIEEAAAAAGGLVENFKGFLDLQGPTQGELIKTAGRLERLGVSGAEFGQSLEFMGKALGMGEKQAARIVTGIASAAADLGMTASQAVSQFREMSGTLALYGPRIEKKFRQIAAAAKASGLSISEVVALGEQFDTFEGATKAVGQLNAYLGGPVLDSMEMFYLQVEQGPEAVQKHVAETLRAQGKSIENMSYSEQKAFAETLGMKVEGFQKLMGFQSEEAKLAEAKAKKEEKAQQRFQKSLRRTMTFAEQIAIAFQSIFSSPELQAAMRQVFGEIFDSGRSLKEIFQDIGKQLAKVLLKVAEIIKKVKKWGEKMSEKHGPYGVLKGMVGIWGALKFGPRLLKAAFGLFRDSRATPVRVVNGGFGGGIGGGREKRGTLSRKAKAGILKRTPKGLRKGMAKVIGSRVLGAGLKKVPFLGALAGLGYGINRAMGGDFVGATMDVASGLASIVPGFGTAASLGIDAALVARDVSKATKPDAATAASVKKQQRRQRENEKKQEDKTKEIGKQIAMGFIEEMKKNSEPSKVEFKFTFDDVFGENSPAHELLWKSINNSMIKKTA